MSKTQPPLSSHDVRPAVSAGDAPRPLAAECHTELPLLGIAQLLQHSIQIEAAQSVLPPMQLIAGEVGTGKRSIATAWHRHAGGREADLLHYDAAALRPDQLHALLFVENSETIALHPHLSGKTVLIAHIERADAPLQALLANLLRPGVSHQASNPRFLLTATNPSRLWPDLRYRLEANALQLPPLRGRAEDLPALIAHFASTCLGVTYAVDDLHQLVTPEAFDVVLRHTWPGNLLELRGVLEAGLREGRLPITHTSPPLLTLERVIQQAKHKPRASQVIPQKSTAHDTHTTHSDVPRTPAEMLQRLHSADYWRDCTNTYAEELPAAPEKGTLLGNITDAVEAGLISAVLVSTSGNIAQSARLLGITRVSLRRKIHSLGLHIPNRAQDQAKSS